MFPSEILKGNIGIQFRLNGFYMHKISVFSNKNLASSLFLGSSNTREESARVYSVIFTEVFKYEKSGYSMLVVYFSVFIFNIYS